MAVITPADGTTGTATPAYVAATAGGDTVPLGVGAAGWSMPTILYVKNGGTGAITVTITIAGNIVYNAVSVTNTATSNPVSFELEGAGPHQSASIAYSGVVTVTVAAVRMWPLPV